MTYRCDECGKFRKPEELQMVYSGGPLPEPDHYACAAGCQDEGS